jgi:hypothetical protein
MAPQRPEYTQLGLGHVHLGSRCTHTTLHVAASRQPQLQPRLGAGAAYVAKHRRVVFGGRWESRVLLSKLARPVGIERLVK